MKGFTSPTIFIPNLPTTDILKTYRTLDQFKNVFGEFRGLTDGWGMPAEMHSSLGWLGFEVTQTNSLRVVSVFLFTVGKRQTAKQEYVWTIDGISIKEGIFKSTGHKPKMEIYRDK